MSFFLDDPQNDQRPAPDTSHRALDRFSAWTRAQHFSDHSQVSRRFLSGWRSVVLVAPVRQEVWDLHGLRLFE